MTIIYIFLSVILIGTTICIFLFTKKLSKPKSPWISVKEKLPYNNPNFIHFGFTNRVLVRDKGGNLFVAYMKKNKDNKWIWCNDVDDNFDLLSEITHWMYIPKL